MALEEFEKEPLSERDKGFIRMRSMMDYGMGILWFGLGVFFAFSRYLNVDLGDQFDPLLIRIFGGICILYGGFRIYRGYKKNYLRER